jgi:hypothetical protein
VDWLEWHTDYRSRKGMPAGQRSPQYHSPRVSLAHQVPRFRFGRSDTYLAAHSGRHSCRHGLLPVRAQRNCSPEVNWSKGTQQRFFSRQKEMCAASTPCTLLQWGTTFVKRAL